MRKYLWYVLFHQILTPVLSLTARLILHPKGARNSLRDQDKLNYAHTVEITATVAEIRSS